MYTLTDVFRKQSEFLGETGREPNTLLLGNKEIAGIEKKNGVILNLNDSRRLSISGMNVLHVAVDSMCAVSLTGPLE